MTLPTVVTIDGLQPQSPTLLRNQLISDVSSQVPGYTASLPLSLVEDVASTDVAAISLCDNARVELVNSMTPYGANQFILNQLGVQSGIPPNTVTNTSVLVVFTGTIGFFIDRGFIVSDGQNQYILQDPITIPSSGSTQGMLCVSTTPGSFAVNYNTVTQLVTGVPSTIALSCNNPNAGTPGQPSESVSSYRSRVIQSLSSVAQGMTTNLRTQLQKVTGVQSRLIGIRPISSGWSILVGGGDPYAVATAIFLGVADISTLQGSSLTVTAMTAANPVVITTNLNSNYVVGSTFTVAGALPTAYNITYTVASISGTTITTTTNGSAFGTYTSGAYFNPNPRNQTITIQDSPDTYLIPYVVPPQQVVGLVVTWNTTATNIVSDDAVAQAIIPAAINYINELFVGQYINTMVLDNSIQSALASIVPQQYLDRLVYAFTLNGVSVTPDTGTSRIEGDPESYFYTDSSHIQVIRG